MSRTEARKIARPKFQPASNRFGVLIASVFEITAAQRSWREFRIAP